MRIRLQRKGAPALWVLYLLVAYVLIQFAWWAWLIVDLYRQGGLLNTTRALMIAGEGTVFLSLLIVGAAYLKRSIEREQRLALQERNFLLATTHEFNSPLAAIKLNLQTLIRAELKPEVRQSLIDNALHSVGRIQALVSNLLMAARVDVGNLSIAHERIELKAVCDEVMKKFSEEAKEAGLMLINSIPLEAAVMGDEPTLQLIFSNAIQNAMKYASPGACTITAEKSGLVWHVKFSDTGSGVEASELQAIFKKFYRVGNEETRTKTGTGLGLYLVKMIAMQHGGRAWASSENGFTLHIELKAEK